MSRKLLAPWQPSLVVVLVFGGFAWSYYRGNRIQGEGFWRQLSFWLGLGLSYIVVHTQFDYYAQYMFFMHRFQHLVLHHLGPFFICLAAPWGAIRRGLGHRAGAWLARLEQFFLVRGFFAVVQNPVVAPLLFVGLIVFWLDPKIHFYAMLNVPLYHLMNASMFVDGLLFWWLILDPASKAEGARVSYGQRILMLVMIVLPQILIGARIALAKSVVYDVYSVCGRAWPIDPIVDQIYSGLITWTPAAMMSVLSTLIILHDMLYSESDKSASRRSAQWYVSSKSSSS